MLKKRDLVQLENLGIDPAQVHAQLGFFERGLSLLNVLRPATLGDGILSPEPAQFGQWVKAYDHAKDALQVVKFVPASGAATRMFGFLYAFLDHFDPERHKLNDYLSQPEHEAVARFYNGLNEFPFTSLIRAYIRQHHPEFKTWTKERRFYTMVSVLVSESGLNFGALPKGLIPFHRYKKNVLTAFEEQLYEAAFYAAVHDEVYTHFTFSPGHLDLFKDEFKRIKTRLERRTKCTFNIAYSFQKDRTKTITVDPRNVPFRDASGALVFRPSGHGALLENLNDIHADIVFIKNIDNVMVREGVLEMATEKKALAGHLIELQKQVYVFLTAIEETPDQVHLDEINSFLWRSFGVRELPKTLDEAFNYLYRPIRVCGVVANTGAPGGGPFWLQDEKGTSLQILESAQFDSSNPSQMDIMAKATHFNPVDLVCGLRDHHGKPYDLMSFCNPELSFIANKSFEGKPIKALELPGLWNGSMAGWNTVFVSVSIGTFNPVKTVNDLLAKAHQPLI